jgi:hypothetical protein
MDSDSTRPSIPDMAANLIARNRQALSLALEESRSNSSQISATVLEIEKLGSRLQMLKSDQEILDQKRDIAAQEYCQSWCQSFSQVLQAKLPRELRDVIYSFLFPKPDTVVSMSHHWRISFGSGKTFSLGSSSIPHYLTSESMGTSLQKEILEALYARAHFRIEDVSKVEKFLEDGLPLGSLPLQLSDHVRSITVEVLLQTYEDSIYAEAMARSRIHHMSFLESTHIRDEYVATQHDLEKRILPLAGIAKVKHLKQLKLHILIRTHIGEAGKKFKEALLPLVYSLQDKGAKVDGECQSCLCIPRHMIFPAFKCDFDRSKSD